MERPAVEVSLRPSGQERCPLCHDELDQIKPIACLGCGTPHHAACLAEMGRCASLGCGQEPPSDLHARRPREVYRRELRERIRRRAQAYAERSSSPRSRGELRRVVGLRWEPRPDPLERVIRGLRDRISEETVAMFWMTLILLFVGTCLVVSLLRS